MKKFLSLVVAALLSVSVATSVTAAKFTDVEASNEALTDAVELLSALNVTKGTTETTFGTAENVTRQQMAAFIYRMMKAGKSVEGGNNTTTFVDLDDPTFYFMISWANNEGIIKGRSATEFDPKGGIILQDAYTMVVRALGYDDGTLSYPIGYISKAEDLGLDEDLPSTLNYTDSLTRGDVAIILANMFYAETAETEIKYETEVIDWAEKDGEFYPITSQKPVEYRKTVAEAIFGVEEVTYRVVATPNASFDGATKPEEDIEMIVLNKVTVNEDGYAKLADEDEDPIEFAELGLEGKADDYILSDILVFEREDKNGDKEIFGATALGTKTTVSFDDVEFGTVTGTAADKYYDADKEYKKIDGKVTLGDMVTYLDGASEKNPPLSFTKGEGNDFAKFITLGEWTSRVDDEEEAALDVYFDYVIDEDATIDENIIGVYSETEVADDPDTVDVDESLKAGWNYNGYLSQVYFGGLGEIDVYDCDGNGKPDYLFVKNYTVATIDTEEDRSVAETDLEAAEVVVYTDKSIVEGVEAEDKDIVLAYVKEDANYVKVAEVLTAKEAKMTTLVVNDYFVLSTGEKVLFDNAQAVVANGDVTLDDIVGLTELDGKEGTYYFAANGTLVYTTGLSTALGLDTDWVVVLSENAVKSVQLTDGKVETSYYVDIYHDGLQKSVKAQKIDSTDKKVNAYYEANVTPLTKCDCIAEGKLEAGRHGDYCYAKYVGKLATAKTSKKGATYFKLLVEDGKTNYADLASEDESKEYRAIDVETEFYKKSGYTYVLKHAADVAKDTKNDDNNNQGYILNGVNIKPYTQIIIKTVEDGEPVVTKYGYDNLPDIAVGTRFEKVSYVLVNNANSKRSENLAVFYGELATTGELPGDTGKLAEVRVIKNAVQTYTEEGTLYTFDVYNPFTGKSETGIEGIEGAENEFKNGDIVALTTTGVINNSVAAAGNAFDKEASIYNVDGTAFKNYDGITDGKILGYVKVAEYDASAEQLFIVGDEDHIYQITDETVVTFADKSDKTIKVVDAVVLGSDSKNYKENADAAMKVFLCVENDDDNDTDDILNVKFAMIVRD